MLIRELLGQGVVDDLQGVLRFDLARTVREVSKDPGTIDCALLCQIAELVGCPLDQSVIKDVSVSPRLLLLLVLLLVLVCRVMACVLAGLAIRALGIVLLSLRLGDLVVRVKLRVCGSWDKVG